MKETEKMRTGELFSQTESEISSQMLKGYILTKIFNRTNDKQSSLRNYFIKRLFGTVSRDIGYVDFAEITQTKQSNIDREKIGRIEMEVKLWRIANLNASVRARCTLSWLH